jgi:hypothetical protein
VLLPSTPQPHDPPKVASDAATHKLAIAKA